jgi:molybdopterin converting factor small subunit
MNINTYYYGNFKDITQKPNEQIETNSKTVLELYEELVNKYGFQLKANEMLISVNNENQTDLEYKIKDNDTIIFLHPMSGG